MSIEICCNACLFQFRVDEKYAGKLIRCPECRAAVSVPAAPANLPERNAGRQSQEMRSVRSSGEQRAISTPARAFQRSVDPPRRPDPSRYSQSGPGKTIAIAAASIVGIGILGLVAFKLGQSGAASPIDPIVEDSAPKDELNNLSAATDTPAVPANENADEFNNANSPANMPKSSMFAGVAINQGAGNSALSGSSENGLTDSALTDFPKLASPPTPSAKDTAIAIAPNTTSSADSDKAATGNAADNSDAISASNAKSALPSTTVSPELGLADLIEKVQPSVVRVDVTSAEGSGHGSGFIIDTAGIVVTNYHVVEGGTNGTVHFKNGDSVSVDGFLYLNGRKDIAILKIDPTKCTSSLIALSLCSDPPRQGVSVAALGAPYGLDFTVSEGIISAVREAEFLRESIGFTDHDGTWIQTTAPISPGNSGGPLVDRQGNVVAINTITMTVGQNLNFGISADDIREGMMQLQSTPIAMSPTNAPVRGHVTEPTSRGALVDAIGTERGRELMKSLKSFRIVRVARSYDVLGTVTSAVDKEAREALEKAGLRESIAASAALILIVNQRSAGNGSRLQISSQLVVEQRSAGQEQLVMIWESSKDVGAISDQALFSGNLPSALKREITNFFRPLRVEIIGARRDSGKSGDDDKQ